MHRLKDICTRLDNCHARTAMRWVKKLAVPPTKPAKGGSPHMWDDAAFELLYQRWLAWFRDSGTTPQLHRAKFTGDLSAPHQRLFPWIFNEPIPQNKNLTGAMEKTHARAEARGDEKKARAPQARRRRPAAAR